MKSEIISRKCIKPSTPTPNHLKTFKLSLLDQLSTPLHGNMTFFYTSNNNNSSSSTTTDNNFFTKSKLLQESLSKTLTLFYPLAGRFIDNATIDCNDEGVIFIEAETNIKLSDLLTQPDFKSIDNFLPELSNSTDTSTMVLVQFTSFTCGGVAISISITHKFIDISTLMTFLQSWTGNSTEFGEPVFPKFIGSSLLPPRDDSPNMSASVKISTEKFSLRRFVFDASKIAELKAKVIHDHLLEFHPSRVEVVLALIWKCALAAKESSTQSFKPSALFQAVNLRKRMSPSLPETAIGNFIWPFMVIVEHVRQLELHEVVIEMRKAFKDFCEEKGNKFKGEEGGLEVLRGLKERGEFLKKNREMSIYKCTSWCKFPLYATDFGFGKPIWHVSVNKMVSNTIALQDTRSGDGIEAFVTLDDEEMAIFECHEELLAYATLNPNAYVI